MRFEIYCDESRQDVLTTKKEKRDKYMLIGGLWLPYSYREDIKSKIKKLKESYNIHGEIKWSKVSPNRISFYENLVTLFTSFGLDLRFRCIVVEADKVDLLIYHDNDQELGFYKFYYQLIHHWIYDFNEYRIFTDIKSNRKRDKLKVLHDVLTNSNLTSKIVSIQALPSKEVVLLQLVDFFLGAVSSKLNCSIRTDGAKSQIIKQLEIKLNRPIEQTSKTEQKFNVFKINLQGGW